MDGEITKMVSTLPLAALKASQLGRQAHGGRHVFQMGQTVLPPMKEDIISLNPNGSNEDGAGLAERTPEMTIRELQHRLDSAHSPDRAGSGENVISFHWITGEVVLYRKDLLGDYGIVFRQDGSVDQNLPPERNATRPLLPAESFNFTTVSLHCLRVNRGSPE